MNEVVVERVDKRWPADRATFEAQKAGLKQQTLMQVKRQKVNEFLSNLRAVAKVDDRRKEVEASSRRTQQ